MRVRETTKRKNKQFNLEKNRYLSHSYRYTPSGGEPPEKHSKHVSKKIFYSGLVYLPLEYLVTRIPEVFSQLKIVKGNLQEINLFQLQGIPQALRFNSAGFQSPFTPTTSLGAHLTVSTACVVLVVLMGLKMDMWLRPLAGG